VVAGRRLVPDRLSRHRSAGSVRLATTVAKAAVGTVSAATGVRVRRRRRARRWSAGRGFRDSSQNPRVTETHIAIVDDEPDITQLLAGYLSRQGFVVTELANGQALMALMADKAPDLVLLDLGLPGEDGFAIARKLRAQHRCGLIIVTGRGDAVDKVVGLEIGADDYVTKPFDLRELLARIKAVLRRMSPDAVAGETTASAPAAPAPAAPSRERERFVFEGWMLDLAARQLISPSGQSVALTGGEFDLLCVLARHAGRVLSRDFLLEQTRGREAAPFDRTVDVQIGRLRRKLEDDSEEPRLIKSVRGAGYVMVAAVTAA
jgi:two-component system OmpR family response regulator